MNQPRTPFRPAAFAVTLTLLLAGCADNAPQTSTGSASRSAASLASTGTMVVVAVEEYANALQHVYVAYFGRPAEPAGMGYWHHQLRLAAAAIDPASLARQYGFNAGVRNALDAFANSGESQALYPGTSAQFIDGVYRNLFNRPGDLAGIAYWSNAIDRGILTRSDAALAIMLGAQGTDAVTVRNKIAVSTAFYALLTQRASSVLAYTGNRNNELARRMLAQVDAQTDLAAFEAIIKATIAQMETGPIN